MNIQLVQHGLDMSCLLDVRMAEKEMQGLVDDLKICADKKRLVLEGVEKGQRSEALGGVLSALVGAGSDPALIKYIMDFYPIGEKYREKGAASVRWLKDEIARAKGFVGSGRVNGEGGKKTISSDCDSDTCDNSDTWQEPEPLHVDTGSQPYPVEALPPQIREAVVAVIGYVQCPPAWPPCPHCRSCHWWVKE